MSALEQVGIMKSLRVILAVALLVIPSIALLVGAGRVTAGRTADRATATPTLFIPTISLLILTPETPVPLNVTVNGLSAGLFVMMPPEVIRNVRVIYEQGLAAGRNANAFTKLGDSTIEYPYFMTRFDQQGAYNLGDYGYLQATIDQFRGSFDYNSAAVRRGLRTSMVFDPAWSDARYCRGDEGVLPCELRRKNPIVIFIRIGSNETATAEYILGNFRRIVEYCIQQGVIPIIGTKADRHEGSDAYNDVMRQVAKEYSIPLWDFDLLAGTIPGRGLWTDRIHLTNFYAYDWRQPRAFTTGYGVHDLSALIALDAVWRAVQQ